MASSPRRKSSGVSKAIAIWALSFTRLEANRNLLTAMSLLPKSIHRCRRYPTKFNSGRDIPGSEHTVLLLQVVDHILLLAVDPASHNEQ